MSHDAIVRGEQTRVFFDLHYGTGNGCVIHALFSIDINNTDENDVAGTFTKAIREMTFSTPPVISYDAGPAAGARRRNCHDL